MRAGAFQLDTRVESLPFHNSRAEACHNLPLCPFPFDPIVWWSAIRVDSLPHPRVDNLVAGFQLPIASRSLRPEHNAVLVFLSPLFTFPVTPGADPYQSFSFRPVLTQHEHRDCLSLSPYLVSTVERVTAPIQNQQPTRMKNDPTETC